LPGTEGTAATGGEAGRLDFEQQYLENDTFARKMTSRRRHKVTQGAPKGSHRWPKMAKGIPKDGQREPKGAQRDLKGSQKIQKELKSAQGAPKTPQRHPKEAKGQRYISKNSRSTTQADIMLRFSYLGWFCSILNISARPHTTPSHVGGEGEGRGVIFGIEPNQLKH